MLARNPPEECVRCAFSGCACTVCLSVLSPTNSVRGSLRSSRLEPVVKSGLFKCSRPPSWVISQALLTPSPVPFRPPRPLPPGVLVVKKRLVRNTVPAGAGGGTVFFVRRDSHRYLQVRKARRPVDRLSDHRRWCGVCCVRLVWRARRRGRVCSFTPLLV